MVVSPGATAFGALCSISVPDILTMVPSDEHAGGRWKRNRPECSCDSTRLLRQLWISCFSWPSAQSPSELPRLLNEAPPMYILRCGFLLWWWLLFLYVRSDSICSVSFQTS